MKRGKSLSSFPYVWVFILIIIVFLIWLLFFSSKSVTKKNCGQDINCFDKMFVSCDKAKLTSIYDNNVYEYVIRGSKGSNCVLYVKLRRVGIGSSVETVDMFQGKDMTCYIPKDQLKEISFKEIDDLINYCSGGLKEAVYELIINRMYSLIIANMGEIIDNVEKDLYKIG